MRIECNKFPVGSHKWNICQGKTKLPVYKQNAYRERWNLPLLPDNRELPSVHQNQINIEVHGHSVDNSIEDVAPYGPGTELVIYYEQKGFESCDACKNLAVQMNKWGVEGCKKHLNEIVDDILPRANTWIQNKTIFGRFLSSKSIMVGLKPVIKQQVQYAIHKAEETLTNNSIRPKTPLILKTKPKRRGCGCGGSKQRTGNTKHISNLILSTTLGTESSQFPPEPKVRTIPFDKNKLKRNLMYHIYPKGEMWKWNVDQLLKRIHLFNGRRIISISVDEESASANEVRKYIGSEVSEYLIYHNNKTAAEMVAFAPSLRELKTNDPNQITFRGHAKGVRYTKQSTIRQVTNWTQMLYETNLDFVSLVEEQLQSKAMTGSCRKFDQFIKTKKKPTYSGTFYWFRNCFVFGRKWDRIKTARWGCEEWPGVLFTTEETDVLCADNVKSMYDPVYFKHSIAPQWETFKRDHAHYTNR